MKKLLFVGVFILMFVIINCGSCYATASSGYFFEPVNTPCYPNEGYIWNSVSSSGIAASDTSEYYDTSGNVMNYYVSQRACSTCSESWSMMYSRSVVYRHGTTAYSTIDCTASGINSCARKHYHNVSTSLSYALNGYAASQYQEPGIGMGTVYSIMYIYIDPVNFYNISGDFLCIDDVTLQIYEGGSYITVDYSNNDMDYNNYSFPIMNSCSYKLVFSDGHEYIFTCYADNIIYDYDACASYDLNLHDDCSNLLINPYTTIYRNEFIPFLLYQGYDNPIKLYIGTDIELGDDIDITVHTCDGNIMLNDPYVEERVRNLFHQDISWDLDITCEDDNTGAKLQGVKVIRTQDCCIIGEPSGYALTQSNGKVCFTGLANSNINVTATKEGYVDYSNTISVGNSFDCQTQGRAFTIYMNATTGDSTDDYNNGTHNDSENTDGIDEETLPSDHGFGCGVYFKNTDGYIVNSIYDTDAYVDMYWWVKNHDGGDSNLKFQYQMYTHWYTTQAYTVSNNTYEYRRIYNTDFNDHTNSYRGYIYNATEGCNDIQTLRVLNHTYENETNYRNLTSHCHFRHKLGGNQIDYRSNVAIKIYANSDNTTLLNITANFMNGSTLEDSITYNWADFVNSDPKWWVVWEPDYTYTSGYNYTVNITGFDGYQLDTDVVWTADIVGSELTVFVKDNYNQPVTNSMVFVEGWGSISTGDKNYVTISGFSQGTYQYKATKSGYISSGWASVDMDGHESVTCILVGETQTSITASKMTNAEIKAFFIPLMYLLLIMMLLGAFKFACGGK